MHTLRPNRLISDFHFLRHLKPGNLEMDTLHDNRYAILSRLFLADSQINLTLCLSGKICYVALPTNILRKLRLVVSVRVDLD